MLKSFMNVLFVIVLCAGVAVAQSTYGTLLGTVKDTSGAVVPNAKVTVTNQNTGVTRSGATNALGDYQIMNLVAGTYRVSVKLPGFKEFINTGVILNSRAIVRVDATLELGSMQTVVEVKAAPPVITTETGTVTHIQSGNAVEQLPLNYRAVDTSPLNAVVTVPGVNIDGGFGISMGGDQPSQNYYSVDGFSSVSTRNNGAEFEQFPSTEAVSEMKVITEVAPAQYSQMGNVDFTTKSGTNQFHGSLFEYFQNSALNAIPDFSSGKPVTRANDFGGSIGGPVILPHYNGKDRTFFFADYEGNRQSGFTGIVDSVPTQAMRQGDLSALCSSYTAAGLCSSPGGTQLVNPFTGAPFANNVIPQSMITHTSTAILNRLYPLPNVPSANPLDTTNNWVQNGATLYSVNMVDARIDQNISSKQSMFGLFTYKNIPSESPLGLLQGDSDSPVFLRRFGISHTYTIHPNLLNEFRFGYAHVNEPYSLPQLPNGPQLISQLGLKGLGPFPPWSGIPYFEFDGLSGVSSTSGAEEDINEGYWNWSAADDVTWIHGRHTLKFGFLFDRYHFTDIISDESPDEYGLFYFNGQYTGYDFGDFLLGLPDLAANALVPLVPAEEHTYDIGTYIQDSIKVMPNLTLNLGLRYEYHPPFFDSNNLDDNVDLQHNAAVIVPNEASLKLTTLGFEQSVNSCLLPTPNPTPYGLFPCTPTVTAATYGLPSTLWYSDKTVFLPRGSLAYRLNPKTVIRAGAGTYAETLLGGVGYTDSGNHDASFLEYPNSITNGVAAIQFPRATGATAAGVPAGTGIFGTSVQLHLKTPVAYQWNFTVERDLGRDTGLQINYTGTHSVNLIVSPDMNQIAPQDKPFNPAEQPFPNWAEIKARNNGGTSSYNALQAVVTHHFRSGLYFQSSWVWARDLTDANGDVSQGGFSGEAGSRIMDRFDLHADYGNMESVPRGRWLTTAIWDLPVGHGKKYGASMNSILDKFVGGWQTSNILIFQTGPFVTPYYNGPADPSGTDPSNRGGDQRPDRLPESACSGMSITQGQLFDGSCFYYGWPGPIGRFGNSGVGILTAPGTALWDFGLSKFFPITERAKLQIQATATNVLNHPNFGEPNMRANSSSFGTIDSLQGVEGEGSRVFQFALRLTF